MSGKSYWECLAALREKKLEQTQEKLAYEGYLDEDDYGRVVPTFSWEIIPNDPDGSFYGIEGWTENFCDLMEKHVPYSDEDDILCGRWMYFMSKMRPTKFKESLLPATLKELLCRYEVDAGIGFDAHFCPDYSIGLELGWDGLLQKIAHFKQVHPEKSTFYDSHTRVIQSIQTWIQHHIDDLKSRKDTSSDPNYARKLRTNEAVLHDKPATLLEALQWITYFHLASRTFNRDGAGGQLDTLLQPYYEKDLAEGSITRDQAVYYLGCFLINDPVYWQIGGPDEEGKDQTCEMSYIILDAAEKINVSLNITLRVHDGMDMALFDRAVDLLVTYKQAWPRFSGDKALVEGFCRLGYDVRLARKRIAVGCNWMSLPGMEYTLNDLFKVNLAKVFEIAWQDMMKQCGYPGLGGDIGRYIPVVKKQAIPTHETASTSLLWKLFIEHLEVAVQACADAMKFHLAIQGENETELLLNLLSHGPIEKGLDVSSGGAMYYNLAIDASGIGTVADSFAALEQRIEHEKRTSWEAINVQLRTSWLGPDGEQLRVMMSSSKKYGSNKEGDAWAEKIEHSFSTMVLNQRTDALVFIPGLFSWAKSHLLGRVVGATPDGRRFGEPITHGANPNMRSDGEGNALVLSSTIARMQPGYGNTAPLQLEFDPFLDDNNPRTIVKSLILAHFALGGTLINVNIVNKEQLLEANRHPEQYPDLVVRVTGFTAYFCMLTPEFRQLVVDRILKQQA
ncbi:MAG: pyruvate formate lyase family protein [Sphaerochaeta sp.]